MLLLNCAIEPPEGEQKMIVVIIGSNVAINLLKRLERGSFPDSPRQLIAIALFSVKVQQKQQHIKVKIFLSVFAVYDVGNISAEFFLLTFRSSSISGPSNSSFLHFSFFSYEDVNFLPIMPTFTYEWMSEWVVKRRK